MKKARRPSAPLRVGEVREFDLQDLRSPDYNPNVLDPAGVDGLRTSMRGFGVVEFPVVNVHPGREGIIVGGSHRVEVAREAGQERLPCVVVDLPPDQERELNLRLNRHRGRFSEDLLAEFFTPEELVAVGFTADELARANAATTEDAGGEWQDGTDSPAGPDPTERVKGGYAVRPVFVVSEIGTVERAISKTGRVNRAEALLDICRAYLGEE